jgi:curli biogenesis system outer membrane secretion channel CsgG
MAVINGLNTYPVVPSDVFGFEVNTDVGYGRETFTITVGAGDTYPVGTVLQVDYAAKTATAIAAPADALAVDALGDLAIFVGKDTSTNPSTIDDFDRLTISATGKGVAITRGDGRGTLYKGYLNFDGTKFHALPADVKAALVAKLTTENRFKVLDQAVAV